VISLSLSLSPIASVSARKKPGKRGRGEQERGVGSWELGVGGGGGKELWLVRVVQWRLYRVSKTFGKLVSYHLQVHFGYFFSLLENWSWIACLLGAPPSGFFMVALSTGVSWLTDGLTDRLTDCLC
jgi:hypothetical protein